jgi:diguanylate cyclase (GGDEF)-like protein
MDVLIAHGAEASRLGLARALQPLGVRVSEAADGQEALETLLAEEAPRVALVDWDLGRIEGPELCRLVRDFHVVDPPYVILLAGAAHGHEVPAGLRAGAHDCVRTPVTAAELQARVEMARRFIELPWGRASSGYPDALTGVLLRQDAVQRLEEELSRARRERQGLGIGILDIDGLAGVNECWGLSAGDAVLREVARRAKSELRPYDVVGRLGGEEFLVILSRTSEPDLYGVLHRLRAAMSAQPFSHDGHELEVTVTLGGVTGEEESAGELIGRAQRSLDEAQAGGPDTVVAGPPAVLEAVLVRE